MRKRDYIAFLISLISLLVVLVLISPYALNLDYVKSFIEKKIYDASGLEVRISGGVDLAFYPEQRIFADNVTVTNRGSKIASIEKAAVYLDMLSALKEKKEAEGVDHIVLYNPVVSMWRNETGRLNIEPLKKENVEKAHIKAEKVTIVNGTVHFADLKSGHDLKLEGLNMNMNDLDLVPAAPGDASFTGTLEVKELHTPLLVASDVSMDIDARKGIYRIDPFSALFLGGRGSGVVSVNVNGEHPQVAVRSDLWVMNIERVFDVFDKKGNLRGNFDLSVDITMQAGRIDETIKTVNGSFVLSGGSIVVKGMDVDEFLNKYRKTQNVGIIDIGAFLIAGPVGTVISSGVEFGGLYGAGAGEDGEIREFISSWEIKNGVMTSRDAAFATEKNRLALNGGLDLVNGKFKEFVVSVLDTDGCSEFTQKVSGSFESPQIEKLVLKRSLFGPAISLIKKAGKLLSGGKCKPFYLGAVQHPDPEAN